jgi:hypothetical protein
MEYTPIVINDAANLLFYTAPPTLCLPLENKLVVVDLTTNKIVSSNSISGVFDYTIAGFAIAP